MSDQVLVNGNQLSWSSVSFRVNGEPFTGFVSISYSDKRERIKTYGMGRHHAPRGRTAGKYTVEPMKIKGPKASIQALRELFASFSDTGDSYGDVELPVVLQYVEATEQMTVEFDRCVWGENSSTDEENPDPLMDEITLDPMLIRRNGLVLFDNSEGTR